jgi:hypothetical protein
MIRSLVVRFKALSIFAVLVASVAVASCSQDIQGGSSCPLLCPQQPAPLKDTIIDGVTFDTSVASYPSLGFEPMLILQQRRDTVDSRIITRFDTLPVTQGTDTIREIDTAFVTLLRIPPDSNKTFKDSARVEVYDVTDAPGDTVTAALLAKFIPANLLGSRQYVPGDTADTVRVTLDTMQIRTRFLVTGHLHLGFRLVTPGSEELRLISTNAGSGAVLSVRVTRDTSKTAIAVDPLSHFPSTQPFLTGALADFPIYAIAPPPPGPTVLRVGGIPGRRVLLRFSIPSHIVDSTAVIRATLTMMQSPTAAAGGDSVRLYISPIIASERLTDLHSLLEFAGAPSIFATDSFTVMPKEALKRSFEMVRVVQTWRGADTIKTPRIVAITLQTEGTSPAAVDLFSIKAPAALRPQLRLTYITKLTTGRP